ncbi:hypothetical protein [Ferviditalea candida]|uniref:Teneurin-like YD-shell domain-containing protein n=1 Tax=Ferviditalea candida TaxID=3108399 RepID=A0ABU5ZG30_9BACL|nr:hypothetical protein [Paenibacillaceae bacterium T2]
MTKQYSYGYDLNGNITSFGNGTSNFSAQYDNLNRVTKVTEPNTSNYLQSAYDDADRRTQLSVVYGSAVWNYDFTYDSSGQPLKFYDEAYNRSTWYLFDESGRLIKSYNSNDTAEYYEYDREGRVTQVRVEKGGEVVEKFRYDYDANDNIVKIWSDIDSSWIEYTYDSLDQLLQEKYSNNTTIQYEYDASGNRTKVITNGVATVYTYNTEKNRLVSVGGRSYQYDANGNVISDGNYTYVWGDDNKLQEVKQGVNFIASFTYDALGNRTSMTAGGVTKTFHYDGERVSYVTESTGKIYRFAYDHSGRPVFMSFPREPILVSL